MIEYVTGNILEDTEAKCLVNPVNCVGVMGKGLALAFKKQFPSMFIFYKNICDTGHLKPGRCVVWKNFQSPQSILLFPTKSDWRRPSEIPDIEAGLKHFVSLIGTDILNSEINPIAFPKLGCGLGGLDWEYEIKPLMEEYLSNLNLTIRIYE